MKIHLTLARLALMAGATVIAVTGLASCQLFGPADASNRQTIEVKPGTLALSVQADGNLTLPVQQKVSFDTFGTITQVTVKKGDRVTKGQVLARLDDSDLKDVVTQRELGVKQQEQTVKLAEFDLSYAMQKLEEVQPRTDLTYTYFTDIPFIRDNLMKAQDNITSALNLNKTGKTAEANAELDKASLLLNQAYEASKTTIFIDMGQTASVQSTISTIRQLSYQKERAEATLASAQVALESGKALLAEARQELNKAVLTAPIGGTISDVPARAGDRLSVATYASAPIVTIVDLDSIEMDGKVDEVDISKVKIGQQAVIQADALPGTDINGKVTFISPLATVRSGVVSYKATISIQPPAGLELKEGMTVTARIIYDRVENVLILPETAVKDRFTKPWVELVESGSLVNRQVTLGRTADKLYEITAGLKAGDKVAV
jgi:multidrug efflux pump subunit AcrA (membrane-fusion protein)